MPYGLSITDLVNALVGYHQLNFVLSVALDLTIYQSHLLAPSEVLYCESVDDSNFVYTAKDVFATAYSLSELEMLFSDFGFLRCSKSTVINLNAIDRFKTEDGARINATMSNGEHIVISRHYAKLLRARLGA